MESTTAFWLANQQQAELVEVARMDDAYWAQQASLVDVWQDRDSCVEALVAARQQCDHLQRDQQDTALALKMAEAELIAARQQCDHLQRDQQDTALVLKMAEAELLTLKAEKARIESENERLQQMNENVERQRKAIILACQEEAAQQTKQHVNQAKTLTGAAAILEEELNAKIKKEKDISKKLTVEMTALKLDNKAMAAQIMAKAQRERSTASRYSDELSTVKRENEQLRNQLQNLVGQDKAQLIEENHKLQREIEKMKDEYVTLRMKTGAKLGQERSDVEMLRLAQLAYVKQLDSGKRTIAILLEREKLARKRDAEAKLKHEGTKRPKESLWE